MDLVGDVKTGFPASNTNDGITQCVHCPESTSTREIGAVGLSMCECANGYAIDGMNDDIPVCSKCDVAMFKVNVSNTKCILCPLYSKNYSNGSSSCTCIPRFVSDLAELRIVEREDELCVPGNDVLCNAGTWRDEFYQCIECPVHFDSSSNSTSILKCKCLAGYGMGDAEQHCKACEVDTYKDSDGNGECTACEASWTTDGNDTSTECICRATFGGSDCDVCPIDTYKPSTGMYSCTPCPANSNSPTEAEP